MDDDDDDDAVAAAIDDGHGDDMDGVSKVAAVCSCLFWIRVLLQLVTVRVLSTLISARQKEGSLCAEHT